MRDDDPPPDDDADAPDDADLIAYLDGELDGPAARAVEAELALDADARARAEQYKRVDSLLDHLPKPGPAPDFTTRTLTRLQPVAAASRSTPNATVTSASGSAAVSAVVPMSSSWSAAAGWLAAAVAAVAVGFAAHAVLRPAPPPDLVLSDLRAIENLPLYLGVDDLDYLRNVADTGLFDPEPPAADAPPRPDAPQAELSPAARDKLIALFRSYPPARQQQVRQLDQAIHDLPPPERDRLTGVLEEYAVWLDRLPDADRGEVLSASGPGERLDAARRQWERAWRDALPARAREQLVQTPDAQERLHLTDDWKRAERVRRDEWRLARRQWDVVRAADRKPWPFADPALAAATDEYVRAVFRVDLAARPEKGSLPPHARLSPAEFVDLKERHDAATREGHWFLYGSMLYRLAERHPSLPEPAKGSPVTEVQHLPKDVREAVKPKALLAPFDRRASRGKWPEFAREVAEALRKANVAVPEGLGPARPGEFTPTVGTFLSATLDPALTPAERDELKALEGKWPAYPERLVALAKAHDLPVPGVTLPGPPSTWARFYSLPPLPRE